MTRILADAPRPTVQSRPRRGFYQRVLRALLRRDVPCLIGGTYALEAYTGIRRATKDLDLFLRRDDWDRAREALAEAGILTSLTFPHWLGKATEGRHSVDLVYGSGNGLCEVDEQWFRHAPATSIWRLPVRLSPPEELVWSKSFVQERERFDGADVLHLIRAQGATLDWARLLERFGPHWEVLLSHLILFGFVFPDDGDCIPARVRQELLGRLASPRVPLPSGLCRGTLLSREQYLIDVEERGDIDARLVPYGTLRADDLVPWTAEIPAARRATLKRDTGELGE